MTFFLSSFSCQSTKKNGVLSERRRPAFKSLQRKGLHQTKKKNKTKNQIKNISGKHLKHIVLITTSMGKDQTTLREREVMLEKWLDHVWQNGSEVQLFYGMFRTWKGKIFAWRLFVLSVLEKLLWLTFEITLFSWNFFRVQMNCFAHSWSRLPDLMYANFVEFNSISKPANKSILYMRPSHI